MNILNGVNYRGQAGLIALGLALLLGALALISALSFFFIGKGPVVVESIDRRIPHETTRAPLPSSAVSDAMEVTESVSIVDLCDQPQAFVRVFVLLIWTFQVGERRDCGIAEPWNTIPQEQDVFRRDGNRQREIYGFVLWQQKEAGEPSTTVQRRQQFQIRTFPVNKT